MTTAKQSESNKKNAQRSTGPKTKGGKAQSSKNAMTHGLRSMAPVVPGETPEAWESHRSGIIASLCPVGTLEMELAERVALSLWRMRRVTAFENESTTIRIEERKEKAREPSTRPYEFLSQPEKWAVDLRAARRDFHRHQNEREEFQPSLEFLQKAWDLPDDRILEGWEVASTLADINEALEASTERIFPVEDRKFLLGLGVPKEEIRSPWEWDEWTARMVREAISLMARRFEACPKRTVERALTTRQEAQEFHNTRMAHYERVAKDLSEKVEAHAERQSREGLVLDQSALDKIMRYEGHLSRQLTQALNTLARLQKIRREAEVPETETVEVTVQHASEAVPLLENKTQR